METEISAARWAIWLGKDFTLLYFYIWESYACLDFLRQCKIIVIVPIVISRKQSYSANLRQVAILKDIFYADNFRFWDHKVTVEYSVHFKGLLTRYVVRYVLDEFSRRVKIMCCKDHFEDGGLQYSTSGVKSFYFCEFCLYSDRAIVCGSLYA